MHCLFRPLALQEGASAESKHPIRARESIATAPLYRVLIYADVVVGNPDQLRHFLGERLGVADVSRSDCVVAARGGRPPLLACIEQRVRPACCRIRIEAKRGLHLLLRVVGNTVKRCEGVRLRVKPRRKLGLGHGVTFRRGGGIANVHPQSAWSTEDTDMRRGH